MAPAPRRILFLLTLAHAFVAYALMRAARANTARLRTLTRRFGSERPAAIESSNRTLLREP
jgi:hypothetical protein